jgi:hypothetical protein
MWNNLIPLTVAEVRRLLDHLVWKVLQPVEPILAWSVWRRRHQARAQIGHYRQRQCRSFT